MATAQQPGAVLPRPRIPNVLGILNLYVGTGLILLSLSIAGYLANIGPTGRAMGAMQKQADAELKAKRDADLEAVEEEEKTAESVRRKRELAARHKEIEARPTQVFWTENELEKSSTADTLDVFQWVDVSTALALDLLLLAAGVGLVRRQVWGLRLGLGTAAAKIARLVLAYGFVIVAIIPPLCQAMGRMAFEEVGRQQKVIAGQGKAPAAAGIDPAYFTRLYSVVFTVGFVAVILLGSIYPAISLWFLSRPGARAACTEPANRFKALSGTQVLGTLNILFAVSLLVFGLLFSAYVAVLPLVALGINQVEAKAAAQQEKAKKAELKALEAEEKVAGTEEEKQAVQVQRKAIEARPKQAVVARVDFNLGHFNLGFEKSHKIAAFYALELASGVILNLALLVAGIGLVRQKRWGIKLGIGTAIAKIARLVVVYTYFAVVLSAPAARGNGELIARTMVFQQQALGHQVDVKVDPSPMIRADLVKNRVLPVAVIVLGSIYPAISIWLLARGAAAATGQDPEFP